MHEEAVATYPQDIALPYAVSIQLTRMCSAPKSWIRVIGTQSTNYKVIWSHSALLKLQHEQHNKPKVLDHNTRRTLELIIFHRHLPQKLAWLHIALI